jgi:glycyl-tRNA synthetase alpha chain
MFTQKKKNVYDLLWNDEGIKYGDVFLQAEKEFSAYNFEHANTDNLLKMFGFAEAECNALIEKKLCLPAYDQCLKASHTFNLLDARGVISVSERAGYITRIRNLAKGCGQAWIDSQQK